MNKSKRLRVIDIVILVIFLSTAVWGIYLFREDLMRTLEMRDADPAGFVVIRDNIVQRRHDDRVLWDRLFPDSPVYSGDLIRAADLSSALLNIGDNEIFLSENTLIRIQHDASGRGPLRVELREGRVNITGSSDEESQEIYLEYMGNQIQTGRGTVLNAQVIADIIAVQVSEGTASYFSAGEVRELEQGKIIAMNETGEEIDVPEIELSPIRFFRADTINSISEKLRDTVSNVVLEAILVRETEIEAPPEEDQINYYTVMAGDTLGRIARQIYGDSMMYIRIVEANNIRNPDLIYPGQVFLLP